MTDHFDGQAEFIRRVSASNAPRVVKMSRRYGMSQPYSWIGWSESYCDAEREKFDGVGVEKRTNVPATILGYALLGCVAVVVGAIFWSWIFR